MTRGRKLLYSERLKPNGLLASTDEWYKSTAALMGITPSALKRIALERYKLNQEKPDVIEVGFATVVNIGGATASLAGGNGI